MATNSPLRGRQPSDEMLLDVLLVRCRIELVLPLAMSSVKGRDEEDEKKRKTWILILMGESQTR